MTAISFTFLLVIGAVIALVLNLAGLFVLFWLFGRRRQEQQEEKRR